MHFLWTFGKIVCWLPPGGLTPPPRGNPGSATVYIQQIGSFALWNLCCKQVHFTYISISFTDSRNKIKTVRSDRCIFVGEIRTESSARASLEENIMNKLSGERNARIREIAVLQNSTMNRHETLTSFVTNSVDVLTNSVRENGSKLSSTRFETALVGLLGSNTPLADRAQGHPLPPAQFVSMFMLFSANRFNRLVPLGLAPTSWKS